MSTLIKNIFVHVTPAKPGIPEIPAHCYEDGVNNSPPNPADNPIKWDGSGAGTGTGDTGGLPKYAFGLPNIYDSNAPVSTPRPRQPGDPVSLYDPAWVGILAAWHAMYG
jgi:hypothetical protein